MPGKHTNNGFGPISKHRSKSSRILASFLVAIFCSIGLLFLIKYLGREAKELVFELVAIALTFSAGVFGELLRRLCLFFEEYYHIEERYEGNKRKALNACFHQQHLLLVIILAVICLLMSVFMIVNFPEVINYQYIELFLIHMLFIPLVYHVLGFTEATQVEFSEMNESQSKNVADGLAWSYYFGYLKLVLPDLHDTINRTDQEIDGVALRDHIEDHKMFIVIPKDCYCYKSFSEVDGRIEFVSSTANLEISRAGVQRRVYKQSVYKVQPSNGETFYCLMEYATPLHSLFDMATERRSGFTEADKEQQADMFYRRLKEILDDNMACVGKYHIVLTSNANRNLADIMAQEIKRSRQPPQYVKLPTEM